VVGLGALTPIGNNVEILERLINGVSGAAQLF
jgi:hypothetical protein